MDARLDAGITVAVKRLAMVSRVVAPPLWVISGGIMGTVSPALDVGLSRVHLLPFGDISSVLRTPMSTGCICTLGGSPLRLPSCPEALIVFSIDFICVCVVCKDMGSTHVYLAVSIDVANYPIWSYNFFKDFIPRDVSTYLGGVACISWSLDLSKKPV